MMSTASPDLQGKRIALLEARMSSELAELVRRRGGNPYSVPAVREHALDAGPQVDSILDQLKNGSIHIAIFQTRVGTDAFFAAAEKSGRLPELISYLNSITTICRGPKPTAALKAKSVKITMNVPEPYTTKEILETVNSLDLRGRRILIIHYGEPNTILSEALRQRVELVELCLYEWLLPEDTAPLRMLIQEIIDGYVDAIVFTSQIQIRHLFEVAAGCGKSVELVHALKSIVVAAVGPTCAATSESFGVPPDVVPEHPKMGPLVLALSRYISETSH